MNEKESENINNSYVESILKKDENLIRLSFPNFPVHPKSNLGLLADKLFKLPPTQDSRQYTFDLVFEALTGIKPGLVDVSEKYYTFTKPIHIRGFKKAKGGLGSAVKYENLLKKVKELADKQENKNKYEIPSSAMDEILEKYNQK